MTDYRRGLLDGLMAGIGSGLITLGTALPAHRYFLGIGIALLFASYLTPGKKT